MAIRRDEMAHHVWGDSEAGFVSDRVISSTDQLHVLEFELPPGGEFRHSPMNQTIFAADVLYYCLQGDYILANPQTGEVVIVPAGTGRLFQRGTWNHGFNPGQTTVRVLEYFSPPPSRGAASDFAKTQPPLDRSIYSRMDLENWPMTKVTQESKTSFWEVSDATALYSFRDSKPSHLIGRLVETAFLSVIKGAVYPGHVEDFKPVETESVIYALEGELWVDVWSDGMNFGGTKVLQPGEAMFLPVGCQERMLVRDHSVARYLKGSGSVPANWRP
jgi:quercetin dioxygenase-like cupin family protein